MRAVQCSVDNTLVASTDSKRLEMACKTLGSNRDSSLFVELNSTLTNMKRSKSDTKLNDTSYLGLPCNVSKSTSTERLDAQRSQDNVWKNPPIIRRMKPVPVKSGVKKTMSNSVATASLPTVMLPLKNTVTLSILTTKPPVGPKLSLDSRKKELDTDKSTAPDFQPLAKPTRPTSQSFENRKSLFEAVTSPTSEGSKPEKEPSVPHVESIKNVFETGHGKPLTSGGSQPAKKHSAPSKMCADASSPPSQRNSFPSKPKLPDPTFCSDSKKSGSNTSSPPTRKVSDSLPVKKPAIPTPSSDSRKSASDAQSPPNRRSTFPLKSAVSGVPAREGSLPLKIRTTPTHSDSKKLDPSKPTSPGGSLPAKKPLVPTINLPDITRESKQNTEQGSPGGMCGVEWKQDDSTKINMLEIMWFHPSLTRHQAEAELTNSEEGVYLLRPRVEGGQMVDGYSLDVRSSHSVKHFRVEVESGDLVLGEHRFSDLESFQEHFAKLPSLGDGTGLEVICKHPYPREIDEVHDYYTLSNHFVPTKSRRKKITDSLEAKTFSLASKEGYLVKVGQRVKTWKTRWFVLKDNNLQYFANKNDAQPIKTISLKEVREVDCCDIPGKPYSFQIVLPERTFYLVAPSPNNRDEWLDILQFKLDEIRKAGDTDLYMKL